MLILIGASASFMLCAIGVSCLASAYESWAVARNRMRFPFR